MHWTDGGLFDLPMIGARCREVGARLVDDASQSLGVMPIDFDAVKPDFLFARRLQVDAGAVRAWPTSTSPMGIDEHAPRENWLSANDRKTSPRSSTTSRTYRKGARRFDYGQRSELELIAGAACITTSATERMGRRTGSPRRSRIARRRIEQRAIALGLRISDPHHGPHVLGVELPKAAAAEATEAARPPTSS